MKLDNYTIDTVSKLIKYSKNIIEENEPAVREALHKYGKDMLNLMLKHEKAVIATKEAVTGIMCCLPEKTFGSYGKHGESYYRTR